MNYFFKLNIVSIIYALMMFIPLELILSVYRITRLTNWEFSTVNIVTCVTVIIVMVGATILLHFLTKKWLDGRKAKFLTVLLWVPYFILFIYVFASLFPMTNGGDEPNPVTGLFVMGGLIAYPFYILILNFVGVPSEDKTM